MRSLTRKGIVSLSAVIALGCNSLDITNPNEPDAGRALADPAAVEAIAGGTLVTFYNTYNGLAAVGPLIDSLRAHGYTGLFGLEYRP